MARYKVTIEEELEYPETQTVYEDTEGIRYTSKYRIKEGTEYEEKEYPTGIKLYRGKEVYKQDFIATDLTNIIKAVNNL